MKKKKSALLILDGWGISPNQKVSAIDQGNKPYYDSLISSYPHAELLTHGLNVGLPKGQMGNSEVGHMNIGAGRVIFQDLVKINKSIEDQSFFEHEILLNAFAKAKKTNQSVHIIGLVSEGGVHSHMNHLKALIKAIDDKQLEDVFIHAITDGRDSDPKGGRNDISNVLNDLKNTKIKLASVIGRYYAMDRDNRWERIEKTYNLLCKGEGEDTNDILNTISGYYDQNITDEFLEPIVCSNDPKSRIKDGDLVIFFNYRADRPRELTEVLSQKAIEGYTMTPKKLDFITFTQYDKTYKNVQVLFNRESPKNTIGEYLSQQGLTQLRIAETEKYAHVTYFFNGGVETPYDGEARIMVQSPKVATYDLKPEMSAYEITEKVIDDIKVNLPDFICLNYANTDMVGHTGVFTAAIKAAETVDECLSNLVPILLENEYEIIIIADHGNSDNMINEDESVNTQHSVNPVPIIYVSNHPTTTQIKSGKLADVAPTLLTLMGVDVPKEMTGNVLV